VEAHDAAEAGRALEAGADIIGVNNRDLRTFTVDMGLTSRLAALLPEDVIRVAESGVKPRADAARLEEAGFDAILVGEALMRAPDKKAMLARLRGEG